MREEPISIPFLTVVKKAKKNVELDPNLVQSFKKIEVSIPLLDAIRQVPKYAKSLKDLCMHKERISELETIPLGGSISALVGAILKKYSDPGPCLVSCVIGGMLFTDCMCDLGACVSIMPLSVYDRLSVRPLKKSIAKFVLADKSIISVVGIAEDVLLQIKDLVFSVDFYILEMPQNDPKKPSSILLGRPFLKTSKFKLDVFSGVYSFEINGRVARFNLEEAMKHPPEEHSILRCDIIDEVVVKVHDDSYGQLSSNKNLSVGEFHDYEDDAPPILECQEEKQPHQDPIGELKPLPSLKVYLSR